MQQKSRSNIHLARTATSSASSGGAVARSSRSCSLRPYMLQLGHTLESLSAQRNPAPELRYRWGMRILRNQRARGTIKLMAGPNT